MRVEHDRGATTLVLSRRNILTLLAKLDGHPPGSACTVVAPPVYGLFAVTAEEDEAHYNHPARIAAGIGSAAGEMHRDTEVHILAAPGRPLVDISDALASGALIVVHGPAGSGGSSTT